MNAKRINTGQALRTTANRNGVTDSEFVRYPHIFPNLVWEHISHILLMANPNDLENLTNSLPFVRDIVSGQRTSYLFGKVFPLVASSVWEKQGLEGLPVSNVLQCRGVCSHWNSVIDKWIAEKLQAGSGVSDGNQASSMKMVLQSTLENSFTSSGNVNRSVQQFLRHFDHTHAHLDRRNPMILKNLSVFIEPDDTEEYEEGSYRIFLDGISLLLSKYGGHLEKFSIDNENFEFFENTSILCKWLSHMTNLKVLEYTCLERWNQDLDLCSYPNINSFLKFKHLQTLEIQGLSDSVLNQLICQNPQISTLRLSHWHPENNIFRYSLPNLKKLELNFYMAEFFNTTNSSQVQWPVESLKLYYDDCAELADLVGCTALFQMLQLKFAHTLVTLDLELYLQILNGEANRQIWEDCKTCRLDLPNLKKIKIRIMNSFISLDFLLPMKHNLEDISVDIHYGHSELLKTTLISGTIIQFIGFEGKMLDSNIWAIFKKLKTFRVVSKKEKKLYSREEWMLNNEYE